MTTARAIIDAIKKESADRFGVSVKDINGNSKQRPIARARMVSMAVMLEKVDGASQSSVARRFGLDHSSVHYAIHKIAVLAKEDPEMEATLHAVRMAAENEKSYWSEVMG